MVYGVRAGRDHACGGRDRSGVRRRLCRPPRLPTGMDTMTHLRTVLAVFFGLTLPAGLIMALYLTDWRHALAGLIAGLTGLVVGTAPRRQSLCGVRSEFRFGDPPAHRRCDRPHGHDGPHGSGGVEWGTIAAPWPAREDLPEEGRT